MPTQGQEAWTPSPVEPDLTALRGEISLGSQKSAGAGEWRLEL